MSNEELIKLARSRYMDTKKMLPCQLEHKLADALEAALAECDVLKGKRCEVCGCLEHQRRQLAEAQNDLKEQSADHQKVIEECVGLHRQLAETQAKLAEYEQQEPIAIDVPEYHPEAMGCGLEDVGITGRYDAMQYGWHCAIERLLEGLPDDIYTHPIPAISPEAVAEAGAKVCYWRTQAESRQAQIDSLMLEYCPDEMTHEQIAEWAAHQKPVAPSA